MHVSRVVCHHVTRKPAIVVMTNDGDGISQPVAVFRSMCVWHSQGAEKKKEDKEEEKKERKKENVSFKVMT